MNNIQRELRNSFKMILMLVTIFDIYFNYGISRNDSCQIGLNAHPQKTI